MFKKDKDIIFWYYADKESFQNYVTCLRQILGLGYVIKAVTSDKHPSIVAAVKWLLPGIPHQFCLVHIQRKCEELLTKRPDTKEGQALLRLVRVINRIRTKDEEVVFRTWLKNYEEENFAFLNARSYVVKPDGKKTWWYTHKNVRLAFRHLKTSLEHMFLYLDNPDIPKDTNGLEAEFTHLKTKLNMHRGLSKMKRENFVNWYWYLKHKKSN